jgi:hypothetical protein
MNKKIKIHAFFKHQLSKEFSVSNNSVQLALSYVYNSETAIKIRQRAKELLMEEAKSISE